MSPSRNCPQCGCPAVDNAQFCFQCGHKFQAEPLCPTCGAELHPNAQFCIICGTKLSNPAPTQAPTPAPAKKNSPAELTLEEVEATPIGDTVILHGREFSKMANGMLMYCDEDGTKYVDAKSYFASAAKRKKPPVVSPDPEEFKEPEPMTYGSSPYVNRDDFYEEDEDEDEEQEGVFDEVDPEQDMQEQDDEDVFTRFQSVANVDGYYDDRLPLDSETFFDDGRKVQWIPIVLGVAGIVLFFAAFSRLSNMF